MVTPMQPTIEGRAAERRLGQTLNGKWSLVRLIDVGGTASVHEAVHRRGPRAAIKILHATFNDNVEVRRRFLREGYVANKIGHPGAVAILDDDVAEDGSPYLVMELLEGESLSRRLARIGGRLTYREMLGVAGQLLDILEMAHANGVVHRDIKPGNILLTNAGHAKLLDFGFARVRDGIISTVPTLSGIVMGTPGYMAPEQARGQPDEIDGRTDIFGVGAVLFRALTGRPVHDGPTLLDALMAAMKEAAPSLASALPGAMPALVSVVDRALAFDKGDRWRNAREMRTALSAVYSSLRQRPPLETPNQATSRGVNRTDASLVLDEEDAPSLVADISFGEGCDEAIERERQRTEEVAAAMPKRRSNVAD
jgi:serine/threonine-protein kinase